MNPRIPPDDPRFRAVVDKRFNKRFTANPDYVQLVTSTARVVSAVHDAVSEGRRLVVTSGGHCLEGFVFDPDVRVIVDVSPMNRVYHDEEMRAIVVEAGATVGETFRALFDAWGTVIPLGEYPGIGMGGHVAGGAFGFLCRQLGLAADYSQIGVAYDYLTSTDHDIVGGLLGLATYGGRINTVAADATASAQRASIFDIACNTGWIDPGDEAKNLRWVRDFYHALFAETGGVPVPGDAYDGTFINHPDADLADSAMNTSGVPWHTLYYQSNYPRLQQVKARWDPRNVFRHALSIRI